MAAAAVSSSAIDLTKQGSYPIRLGDSILKPGQSSRHCSVKYNYRPSLRDESKVVVTIKPSKKSGSAWATLRDGEEEYKYSVRNSDAQRSYVLLCSGRDAVLETLDTVHLLNLCGAPSQKDEAKLLQQCPSLEMDDGQGEMETGFEDCGSEEQDADPGNPFDYRHFLKAAEQKAQSRSFQAPSTTAGMPLVQPRAPASTPLARPNKRTANTTTGQKRKAPISSQPSPRRVKASSKEPSPAVTKAPPRPGPPRIRKVPVRQSSMDDSGELILENETPTTDKPNRQHSAMSLALAGQLGQGPISLRSAAGSPASHTASPMPERPSHVAGRQESQLNGSSPETGGSWNQMPMDNDEDADDAGDDADVDGLELPSPAQAHRPSVSAATVTGGDDEDDLDKELALAMAEDDDDGPTVGHMVAEDEESEEE